MPKEIQKLSIREKIGYGLGDTASNLFFQTFILFLLYFYTDVYGISASAVGTMFLFTRIWDALGDPVMGAIADRTRTRWGKFRPYLLWFAVPFGIFGIVMFITPNLSPTGKLIYAYVTYTLMLMMYSIVNVPYSALMGVITPNSQDRTIVSSFRFVSAFIGMFIVQYFVLKMVKVFGGQNEAAGWQWAMTVLSIVATLLFLVTFATTKERVHPAGDQPNPLGQDLKDLLRNKPWLLIGGTTVLQLMYAVMRGSSIMYYFEYFIQNGDISLLGKVYSFSSHGLASAFMLAGTIVTILGAILANWFSGLFGKTPCYAGFLTIGGVSVGLVYMLSRQNIIALFVFQILASFSQGIVSVLQWAIYTDTADYSEWRTGRRATALIMAASLFALKLGVALGGAIVGWVLAHYGYRPNAEQTPKAVEGIRLVMTVYPAVFALLGAAIMAFYPLNKTMMNTIETDLMERRRKG